MIETNKDKLVKQAVMGKITHPVTGLPTGYVTTWDGGTKLIMGLRGINYNLRMGDSCFGWAWGDHVEPGVIIQSDEGISEYTALSMLACIGNEAVVATGEAKGEKGIFVGRHGTSDDIVHFTDEVKEKLAIGDKIQIKAFGVGLEIKGFEDVRVNKCSPRFLESIGIEIADGKLVVPIVMGIPPFLMGSGIGHSPTLEGIDYDIQTTCPEAVEEYGLEKLRLGDLVLLRDQLCVYGRQYWKGAMTVGVVIHGASDIAGHGPGVDPILSTKDGRIATRIDPHANIAYYLGLREKPKE